MGFFDQNEEEKENFPSCSLCKTYNREEPMFLLYMCQCYRCINRTVILCRNCVLREESFIHQCLCNKLHRYCLTSYRENFFL